TRGTRMATNHNQQNQEDLALKAIKARRLTDPLGALGQRRSMDRIEREARLRRGLFVGSLAIFSASFALVTVTGTPSHDIAPVAPEPIAEVAYVNDSLPLAPASVRLAASSHAPTTIPVLSSAAPTLVAGHQVSAAAAKPIVGNRVVSSAGVAQSPATAAAAAMIDEVLGPALAQAVGEQPAQAFQPAPETARPLARRQVETIDAEPTQGEPSLTQSEQETLQAIDAARTLIESPQADQTPWQAPAPRRRAQARTQSS
ncbi:MAG: hypothetical protein ACR2J8_02165, partial [Thermomicrobiales bacterium]